MMSIVTTKYYNSKGIIERVTKRKYKPNYKRKAIAERAKVTYEIVQDRKERRGEITA